MRIKSISNIPFKSTPLYDVKVKKKGFLGYENVDATISLYNPDDKNDVEALEKAACYFGKHSFARGILENFKHGKSEAKKVYVLELKGTKPIEKRILSLCESFISNGLYLKKCYVNLLQSITKSRRIDRNIYKGAGEVMLYGVTKEAQKAGMNSIRLTSVDSAKMFYEHVGFIPIEHTLDYTLPREAYDKYINRINKKYGIKEI